MASDVGAPQAATARPGVLATLRDTPVAVRYLLGGVLVNQLGAFVQTFLVLYLTVKGFSAGHAGLALAAYSVGAVGGTLLGGELTQRFGPRATIVTAMSASGVVVGVLPVLSRPGLFAPLLAAVALAGLVTQAYRPAAAVVLSDLMPASQRVMGFSMMRTALNAGAALGPLIAAGLILIDWNLLFWFDALTAVGYALLARAFLPALPAPPAPAPDEGPRPAGQARSTYGALLRNRPYLFFLGSVLIGSLIYAQENVALPLMLRAQDRPTALYSAVLAVSSIVLIASELKITSYVQDRDPARVGALGTALMGLGAATFGLSTQSIGWVFVGTVVFVLGVMISGPMMFAHPATFPDEVKARYIAAHQATFGVGMALGPIIGVLAWEGLHDAVWLWCGILGVIAGFLALVGMRPARQDA